MDSPHPVNRIGLFPRKCCGGREWWTSRISFKNLKAVLFSLWLQNVCVCVCIISIMVIQILIYGYTYGLAAATAAKSLQLCLTLCDPMAAHQAPPSLGFSRQEHWSGLPFPSPMHESEKWKWSRSVVCDSSRPHGLQPTRLLRPWDFPGKSTGVGCHCLHMALVLLRDVLRWITESFHSAL